MERVGERRREEGKERVRREEMSGHIQEYAHKIVEQFFSEVTQNILASQSFTGCCLCVFMPLCAHGLFLFALLINTRITREYKTYVKSS